MTAPRDTDCYIDAIAIFASTGNITMTHRILEDRGYVISKGTVTNWYKAYKADWDNAREVQIKIRATSKIENQNFLEIQFVTLKDTTALLQKRLDNLLADPQSKSTDIVAAGQVLNKSIEQLLEIQKLINREGGENDRYVKALINVLFRNAKIGPLFKKEYNSIMREIQKEIKKTKNKNT